MHSFLQLSRHVNPSMANLTRGHTCYLSGVLVPPCRVVLREVVLSCIYMSCHERVSFASHTFSLSGKLLTSEHEDTHVPINASVNLLLTQSDSMYRPPLYINSDIGKPFESPIHVTFDRARNVWATPMHNSDIPANRLRVRFM